MSDPVSVRHALAASDYSERIQKADAVHDQGVREHFAHELQRREELKQSQVNEGEQTDEVRIREDEEKRRKKEEEKQRRQALAAEEPAEELEEPSEHLIDLKV